MPQAASDEVASSQDVLLAVTSKIEIRTGQAPAPLSRQAFGERYRAGFVDPAFAAEQAVIVRLEEIAWQAYDEGRKAPLTRLAGPGYADVVAVTTLMFALSAWFHYPLWAICTGSVAAMAMGALWLLQRTAKVSLTPL